MLRRLRRCVRDLVCRVGGGAEPCQGSFDDPAVLYGDELVAGGVLDDLDHETQACCPGCETLVGGVAAHDAEHAVAQPSSAQDLVAAGHVGDVCGGDQHGDQ